LILKIIFFGVLFYFILSICAYIVWAISPPQPHHFPLSPAPYLSYYCLCLLFNKTEEKGQNRFCPEITLRT
jgi:hypothetical protein